MATLEQLELTSDLVAAAEQRRLAALSATSAREDTVQIEMLYEGRWVRFDIPAISVGHLTPVQLIVRYFAEPLKALGFRYEATEEVPDAAGSSSSESGS